MNAELLAAAKRGDVARVRARLSEGAEPNAAEFGTAMYWAARINSVQSMEALADAGAAIDPPRGDSAATAPLAAAAMKGHAAAVLWLLRRGADWRRIDMHGHSARDLAAQWGRTEATAALDDWIVENGADELQDTDEGVRYHTMTKMPCVSPALSALHMPRSLAVSSPLRAPWRLD